MPPHNVLHDLTPNERPFTLLFSGLMAHKSFRDIIITLFTSNDSFDPNKIEFGDIDTTPRTDEGSLPDMAVVAEGIVIYVEIKIGLSTPLQDTQPVAYLDDLKKKKEKDPRLKCVFVALTPEKYQHLDKLKGQAEEFELAAPGLIRVVYLTWEEVARAIKHRGLNELNSYFADFLALLESRYDARPIEFTKEEIMALTEKETAAGIGKVYRLVARVNDQLPKELPKGVELSAWVRPKTIGADGVKDWSYGLNISSRDPKTKKGEGIFFGMWLEYWERTGNPICISMDKGKGDPLENKFSEHEGVKRFSDDNNNQYLVMPIKLENDPDFEKKLLEQLSNICRNLWLSG